MRDKSGKVLLCNSKYLTQLGAEPKAILGQPFAQGLSGVLDAGSIAVLEQDFARVLQEGSPSLRIALHHRGTQSDIYHWMVPYFDGRGPSAG